MSENKETTRVPREYGHPDELYRPAESCVVSFPPKLMVHPGQAHPHVLLAKAMLAPFSPVLDGATADNLRHIQRCSDLPETGVLDKKTWNRLCMLYRALFDRYHPPAQG